MPPNKRLFIAFSITMILLVAIFTSIARSLISISSPPIILPSLASPSTDDSHQQAENSSLYRIEVTPTTLHNVILALQKNTSYSRSINTTLYGQDNALTTTTQIWYQDGLTHVSKTLPTGLIRHDMILNPEHLPENSPLAQESPFSYYWYQDSQTYLSQPLTSYANDLAQHIPTYETILNLNIDAIQQANYQIKEGFPSIFIEATPPPLYYTERFWVSTETGLLLAAETYEGDKLIYSMTGYTPITSPLPAGTHFSLPDGTLLLTSP